MLHKDCHELVTLREAIHLLLRDRPHQSSLSAVSGPQQAIELELLEVQFGLAEKGDSAVGEGEAALVQVDRRLIVIDELLLAGLARGDHVRHNLLADISSKAERLEGGGGEFWLLGLGQ